MWQRQQDTLSAEGGVEGKSLTSWLEKAGAVAHAQQSGAEKLVKQWWKENSTRGGGRPLPT
jgi:hypothetical protein